MGKKDNRPMLATQEMRQLADKIRNGRKREGEWNSYVSKRVEELKAIVGTVDVTLETALGEEVASITETEPSKTYDYKAYFAANPAHKADLEANYRKPPTTQVRVLTQWVERPAPAVAPPTT